MEDNVINMLFRYSDIFDLWITRLQDENAAALHSCDIVSESKRYSNLIELCCIAVDQDQPTNEIEYELEDICMDALVKSIVQLSDNAFLDELLQTAHSEYVLQFVTKN